MNNYTVKDKSGGGSTKRIGFLEFMNVEKKFAEK